MTNINPKIIPLIISSVGLNDSDEKTLLAAIKHTKSQGITCRYLGSDRTEGHLVVIDIDSDTGNSALKSLRPGQVKLAFTTDRNKISGKNIVTIAKPLKEQIVNALFLRIANKLDGLLRQKQAPQSTPENNATENSSNSVAAERKKETLFHVLLDAKKKLQTISISIDNTPPLLINGVGNSTATEMNAEDLRNMLAMPSSNVKINDIEVSDIPTASNAVMTVASLDASLWTAGIMWRPATLIGNVDLETPVRLKAWPNFTRNNFFSEHLKLSAALAVRPISLQKLHSMTEIPLEEITCFYNAAFAVGLIEIEDKDTSTSDETTVEDTPPPFPQNKCKETRAPG
ncbi:hypothetical protein ACFL2V_10510 [Pseudomonadota bacterium]